MKKLLTILLLFISYVAFAQVSPVTLQVKGGNSVNYLPYSWPGKTSPDTLFNAKAIRALIAGSSSSFLFDPNFRIAGDSVHLAHIVSIDSNLNIRATKAPWYDNTVLTMRADVGLASSNTFKSIDVFNNLYAVGPDLASDWRYKHSGRANVISLSDGALSYKFAPFGAAGTHAILFEPFRVDTSQTTISYKSGSDSTGVSIQSDSFNADVLSSTGEGTLSANGVSSSLVNANKATGNTANVITSSINGGFIDIHYAKFPSGDQSGLFIDSTRMTFSDPFNHVGPVGAELFTVSGDPNQYVQFGNLPGGGSDSTLYKTNGSLTGDRTVTMGSHSLLFDANDGTDSTKMLLGSTGYRVATTDNGTITLVANAVNGDNASIGIANPAEIDLEVFDGVTSHNKGITIQKNSSIGSNVLDDDGYGLTADVSVDTAKMSSSPRTYVISEWVKGYVAAHGGGGSTTHPLTFGYGFTSISPFDGSSAETAKIDTSLLQTVLNFFPKGDTRYYKASNPSGYISAAVTSITPGVGFLSHTPITNTGTMNIDTAGTIMSLTKGFAAFPTKAFAAAPVVGNIYSKAYWTSLADFTAAGFTPSVSGAGIQFTGGSNTYTQTMIINGFTNADPNIDVEVGFVVGTTGHGLGLGRKSVDVPADIVVQYDETTNSMIFTALSGTIVLATIPSNFTVVNGDNCVLKYSQRGNVITGTFTDFSHTGFTFSYSIPMQTGGYNSGMPNTSDVCLYNVGGTRTISNITYKSRSLFNPTIAYVGDSKTQGLGVNGLQFAWAKQLGVLGSSEIYAGGGDKIADMLAALPYIINYIKPKIILLSALRNDLSGGTIPAPAQAAYLSYVSTAQAAGITVYLLGPIPETVISNQSAITTFQAANFASSMIIDPSAGAVTFNTSTMLAADGIHLNDLGNTTVTANILNAAVIPTATTANPLLPNDPILTYPVVYTANRIPFGNGTTTLATAGGFIWDGSHLGINNPSPTISLDVFGNLRLLANGGSNVQMQMGTSATTWIAGVATGVLFSPDEAANDKVEKLTSNTYRYLWNANNGVSNAEMVLSHTALKSIVPVLITPTLASVNASATLTAAQMQTGTKTSSTTAVALTTCTATALATQLGASQGSTAFYTCDNTASTSLGAIVITLGSGITSGLNAGLAVPIGKSQTYMIYFTSATTCIMSQIL